MAVGSQTNCACPCKRNILYIKLIVFDGLAQYATSDDLLAHARSMG